MSRQCADCGSAMLRVPYMKDAHSRRVWLDRCPKCKAVWFDAGEAEATSGTDLHLELSAAELQAQCPVCRVPLYEAKLTHAEAAACVRCRGVHLKAEALPAVSFQELGADEATLKPPPMFECVICHRTFSLDQGDGVTCGACAPSKTVTGEHVEGSPFGRRLGLAELLGRLFDK
ncbi:MAG: zf-TFIIB domain-containing protein [Archangiaceae bacterium]|nr:zf-TFIIB domain-containing protein [Archangiaceae bacterium]